VDRMTTRKLVVWRPKDGLEGPLHYVEVKFADGLQLVFEDESNTEIKIIYNQNINSKFVLAFRFTDDLKRGDLSKIAREARIEYFNTINAKPWYFYKMINSDFIHWFDQLPGPGSNEISNIQHFIFMCSEETFEVISEYEPIVQINKKKSV
ncbi:hypothetical protein, partial [Peribacillus alkalitolerans]